MILHYMALVRSHMESHTSIKMGQTEKSPDKGNQNLAS